jgi:hypothetical protein
VFEQMDSGYIKVFDEMMRPIIVELEFLQKQLNVLQKILKQCADLQLKCTILEKQVAILLLWDVNSTRYFILFSGTK